MPNDYIDFTFQLDTLEDSFSEEALDRILDAFIEAVEAEDWCLGGSCGPAKAIDEDKVCERCDGIGVVEPIPEERKCGCKNAAEYAIFTDKKYIPAAAMKKLDLFYGKYLRAF